VPANQAKFYHYWKCKIYLILADFYYLEQATANDFFVKVGKIHMKNKKKVPTNILVTSLLALVAIMPLPGLGAASSSPLKNADYLWHMADASNARGGEATLQVEGAVSLGEELNGPQQSASRAGGGDGHAARFDGGYISLTKDRDLDINAAQWTVAVRIKDPEGTWDFPILGSYGSDKDVSIALRSLDARSKPMTDRDYLGREVSTSASWLVHPDGPRTVHGHSSLIEAVWGAKESAPSRVARIKRLQSEEVRPNPLSQDVMNAVMRVNFPVGLIGPREWHDVVLAFTGPKLRLFIDGVLVDEEFPIGETRKRTLPFLIGAGHEDGELKTGFRGLIDHVAV